MIDFDAHLRTEPGACAMEWVSLLRSGDAVRHNGRLRLRFGRRWWQAAAARTDSPPCTNKGVARAVQQVNDSLTAKDRQRLGDPYWIDRILRARKVKGYEGAIGKAVRKWRAAHPFPYGTTYELLDWLDRFLDAHQKAVAEEGAYADLLDLWEADACLFAEEATRSDV